MKPTDPVSLYNWEAMAIRTKEEDAIIKKRLEEIWRKNYKKK